MVLGLPREIAFVAGLLAVQLLWSQIHPYVQSGVSAITESWPAQTVDPTTTSKPPVPDLEFTIIDEVQPDIVQEVVRWLPPLKKDSPDLAESGLPGVTILPVFPLSSSFYAPLSSSHILKIFEPRYRQLYDDIMSQESPRFVVTQVDPASGRLAEVGVVFHVDSLTDVSKDTGDTVKYVCEHRVVGRVRIQRILNPSRWASASTYLRAETVNLEDQPESEDMTAAEADVSKMFQDLAGRVLSPVPKVSASKEASDGFWSLVDIWINQYLAGQLLKSQERLQQDLQDHLQEFFQRHPEHSIENLEKLPPEASHVVEELHSEFQSEQNNIRGQQLKLGQQLLQATTHAARLQIVRSEFNTERFFRLDFNGVASAG